MNFVDKEDVTLLEAGEQSGQITGFFHHGSGGDAHTLAELVAQNKRQGGFAESRWTAEENVVEGVAATLGGTHHDLETLDGFGLPGEITKREGPQGRFGGPNGSVEGRSEEVGAFRWLVGHKGRHQ